jgi:hypothetical protein
MFIVRFMLVLALVAGVGLLAMLALGNLVEPEPSDVQVNLPLPKPKV